MAEKGHERTFGDTTLKVRLLRMSFASPTSYAASMGWARSSRLPDEPDRAAGAHLGLAGRG